MKTVHIAGVMLALMLGSAVAGMAVRPTKKAADVGRTYVLDSVIPRQFGDWREIEVGGAQVVNPQTQQLLDKLYSQILTRSYVDSAGYRIMLSLAYGDDQTGDLQAHKPEVCYPAQGFALTGNAEGRLATRYGDIDVRRLNTELGPRKEPVTYWFAVGDRAVKNKFEQRMMQLKLGLTGQIPDGILFRVSSIDATPQAAYAVQDRFVGDLMASVTAADRLRLAGLSATTPGAVP